MAEFKKIACVSDIPEGQMRSFEIGYDRIVVCHTAKGFFALADECSHDSGPISEGKISGDEIVCPRHGARFNVLTGDVTAPPAVVGIDVVEIKIENDDIFVAI